MSGITTHVLDTALGRPATGVPVRLERVNPDAITQIGRASTDDDGRVSLLQSSDVRPGTYRLVFDTAAYYRRSSLAEPVFFPEVTVTFAVSNQARNYHVPLLLSPFGYSTYRGS